MAGTKGMNPKMSEQKKQAIVEQLWLTYYNDTLFARGLISEAQRNKMRTKIRGRTVSMCR